MVRRWCSAAALCGVLLSSTLAAAGPRRIALAGGGPSSGAVTAALGASLPGDEWNAQTVLEAMQPPGEKPLDAAMARPKDRAVLRERARAAGESVQADVVVLVRVTRAGRVRRVTLVIVDPAAPTDSHEVQVLLPLAAAKSDGDKLVAALMPILTTIPASTDARAAASPGPRDAADAPLAGLTPSAPGAATNGGSPTSPAPASSAAGIDADTGPIAPSASEPAPILRLALVGGVASRTFSYRDALSPGLRTYDLAAVPTLGGRLDVFPFARARGAAVRGLGAYGDIAAALGLSSESTSQRGSSRWTRWDAGARFQAPIARARVGAAFGYGRETFGFDMTGVGTLPSTDYAFLRPALEGGFDVGPIAVDATAAYLVVLEGGALADRARGTSIGGVEGRALVRYGLGRHVDVSIGGAYTRFFYAFKPVPGDELVSGGALDQMLRGELALAGRY